jgi:hypothetical protein
MNALVDRMPSLFPIPPVLRVSDEDSWSMPAPIDSLLKFQSTFSPLIISTMRSYLIVSLLLFPSTVDFNVGSRLDTLVSFCFAKLTLPDRLLTLTSLSCFVPTFSRIASFYSFFSSMVINNSACSCLNRFWLRSISNPNWQFAAFMSFISSLINSRISFNP